MRLIYACIHVTVSGRDKGGARNFLMGADSSDLGGLNTAFRAL